MLILSGPSNIWEAILALSMIMIVPLLTVLVVSHTIIKGRVIFLEKIKKNIIGQVAYWLLLFVMSFLICLLGYFSMGAL